MVGISKLVRIVAAVAFTAISGAALAQSADVGLVNMLGSLNNPESIGPAMAVALLTTLYGALLANVVFLPLASKLERNSATELLINQIYILGSTSIGRQENPRRLELILNTILPASQRVKYFD